MKDKPQLLTPTNIPQEDSNEVVEQIEESQDLFILADSSLGIEGLELVRKLKLRYDRGE